MKMEAITFHAKLFSAFMPTFTFWKDMLHLAEFGHSSSRYDIDMKSADLRKKCGKWRVK